MLKFLPIMKRYTPEDKALANRIVKVFLKLTVFKRVCKGHVMFSLTLIFYI